MVPPPFAPRTVPDTLILYSDIVWYELHQTFRVSYFDYLRQFSFFFKRKGGFWDLIFFLEGGWLIEDLQ